MIDFSVTIRVRCHFARKVTRCYEFAALEDEAEAVNIEQGRLQEVYSLVGYAMSPDCTLNSVRSL